MKTVTLPVYRRVHHLRKVLESLRRNDTTGYVLFVSAEPGYPEVIDLVRKVDFMPLVLHVNDERKGLNENIKACLHDAMENGSEFNIAIEDDVELAPDAFALAEWFRTYEHNSEYGCLGLCQFSKGTESPDEITEAQEFRSWGYCFTRDSWHKHFVHALEFVPPMNPDVPHLELWDFRAKAYFMMNAVKLLHPRLSRTKHLGLTDGENFIPDLNIIFSQVGMSTGKGTGNYQVTRLPEWIWEKAREPWVFE